MSFRSTGLHLVFAAFAVLPASPYAVAQTRHSKPVTDGGLLEARLLDRIQNEPDDQNRLVLLRDFAAAFPKSKSLLWTLESIQSIHLKRGDYRAAMESGDRVLKFFPADLDTPLESLKAAETISDFESIRRYATETWKRASWLAKKPGEEGESARRAMDYAEASLATLALQGASAESRQLAMTTLSRLNPQSAYLPGVNATADRSAGAIAVRPPAPVPPAIADNPFRRDFDDIDVLMAEAERLTKRGDSYWKVLDYSRRAIKKLQAQPEDPRRDRQLTAAYWMSGMAATIVGLYGSADHDLRVALPALRDNRPALGLTLYSLGYVNFRLAEDGNRKLIFEALRFNRECAAVPGPYREQALQNIESIKIFYNMK